MPLAFRCLPTVFNAVGAAVCVLLAACGGGGGGGGGAAPGSGASAAATLGTLTLSTVTAEGLDQRLVQRAEVPLTIAEFAVELTGRFSEKGKALSVVENCSGQSGKLNIVLTDRDGNGIASAGDRIVASFDHCTVGLFNDGIIGSLALELSAPTTLANGTVNGVVQLEGTLALPREQQVWSGSFRIATTRTDLARSWTVSSSEQDDLRVVKAGSPADNLRSLGLSKSVDFERARNTVDLRLTYETPAGSVLVSTPTVFGGFLQRPPDTGVVEMQGANAKARITVVKSTSSTEARLEFVASNGSAQFLSNWPWILLTKGFLWWDGQTRDQYSGEVDLDTRDYAADFLSFSLVAPEPAARTLAGAVYRFQFRRPPADLSPTLVYRFTDSSANDTLSPLWNIPAGAERHGALLLVRPAQPLRHGHSYRLDASADGVTWSIANKSFAPDILVHDAEGHEARIMYGAIGSVHTPDTLRAAIASDFDTLPTAAARVMLSATATPDTGRSIVRYRWSQVSGTPLHFSAPDAASTGLSWGSTVPSGIEFMQVQLEVTDSNGDTETTRRMIGAADVVAQRTFMVLRGDGLMSYRQRNPEYFYDFPGDAYYMALLQPALVQVRLRSLDENLPRNARLTFTTPAGVPFKVGSYAFSGAQATSTTAPDMVLQHMDDYVCSTRAGTFEVREVVLGADGVPTRLAVDFQHSCNGAASIFGSYRLNSTVPVAP